MQSEKGPDPNDPKVMKAELVRLRIKLSETEDVDIRTALKERITQLEAKMPAPEAEAVAAPPPPPPTPAQAAEAEQLVRQARVEKMRNNTRGATDLLKKASEIAPGSPAVLEVLGDDYLERRQIAQAKDAYQRASQLDPKNVGLERKYATLVAQTAMMGSLDDQMRASLSDSPFINSSDARASGTAAVMLSAIFPGLGHIVLGRQSGFAILGAWIVCLVWVILLREDVKALVAYRPENGTPNMVVMVPLLIMALIYFSTLASLKSAQRSHTRKPISHPQPPVDKNFEI
ncbi:hypothetical protein BH11ARM1_BH11ARM1_04420 [soil metagenome]